MEREKSKGIRFRPWAVPIAIRGPSPHKTRLRMTLSKRVDFSKSENFSEMLDRAKETSGIF